MIGATELESVDSLIAARAIDTRQLLELDLFQQSLASKFERRVLEF